MIGSERDLRDYLTAYAREMAFGQEDAATVLERWHTPEIRWFNDGVLLDRERLIAHARPVRKNVLDCEVEVHDAIVADGRIAARYTLRASMRKGGVIATEIYMFGQLAGDGRISRVDQITRTLTPAEHAG